MLIDKETAIPFCAYPTALEVDHHGVQNLPIRLTPVSFKAVAHLRIKHLTSNSLSSISDQQVLEVARLIAEGFAKKEPTQKHIQLPETMPEKLKGVHNDAFGKTSFGDWTSSNLFFWLIRLMFLTNPESPAKSVAKNEDVLDLSLVLKDGQNNPIAGVLSHNATHEPNVMRMDNFLSSVLELNAESLDFIFSQEYESISQLKSSYPEFDIAWKEEKVANMLMLAKTDEQPSYVAFELFARGLEHLKAKGYQYVLVAGSNQWTGAACELMNGTRVHFKPFRDRVRIAKTSEQNGSEVHSQDGYLAAKDSGIMFYVLKF